MNKNSDARIASNNRYNAKAYDRINIAVKKGQKELIQEHIAATGESMNSFVTRAIFETIERDNLKDSSAGNNNPDPEQNSNPPAEGKQES